MTTEPSADSARPGLVPPWHPARLDGLPDDDSSFWQPGIILADPLSPGADPFARFRIGSTPADTAATTDSFSAAVIGTAIATATDAETSAVSQAGAVAMNVPTAAARYGATGAGIKIGIISDSFNSNGAQSTAVATEEANGDLPGSVTVLTDYSPGSSAGTDEGRAMAELVHAVAPGATLYFSTAYATEQDFANSILALAAAGATIIVDDVTYFHEPFFGQPSVISQAIEAVVARGVSYFSAAGNSGSNYYETAISFTAAKLPGGHTNLQMLNFGATAAANSGSNTLQDVQISGGATVYIDLQWNQPFRSLDGSGVGTGAGSAYSLAIFLYDLSGHLVTNSTTNVTGSDPVQVIAYQNAGSTAVYQLAIVLNGGSFTSGTLKYVIFAGSANAAVIEDSAAGTGSGSIVGHAAVDVVNTIAATPASNPTAAESFSSTGAVDVTAPDGIATSVSGFSSFYGTSAAAPDAAAVGAMMQQVNHNLTPAQLSAALADSAAPISGSADKIGAGLVDADAALAFVYGSYFTIAAGGAWSNAAGWSTAALPNASTYVTLGNAVGALTSDYTLTVDIAGAAAATLTVGDAPGLAVMLVVAAGASLSVAGSAYLGAGGGISVDGSLSVGSDLDGSASSYLSLVTGGILSVAGTFTGAGLHLSGGRLVLSTSDSAVLTGGLTSAIGFSGTSARIDLTGLAYSAAETRSYSGGTLSISLGGVTVATLAFDPASTLSAGDFTLADNGSGALEITIGAATLVACFRRGTRIATPAGDMPIEALRIGDPVLTRDGAIRTIHWIGRRGYDGETVARERDVQPIRIAAGALGDALPRRDLHISAQHALVLDDGGQTVLVPACLLLNGASIIRIAAAEPVDYLHLELKAHEAILAEGLACESFVDRASRAGFDNAAEHASLYPAEDRGAIPFLAPRLDQGAALLRLRAAIEARAGIVPGRLAGHVDHVDRELVGGWALDQDHPHCPVALEIVVDGQIVATLLADRPRGDLDVVVPGGACSFLHRLDPPLDPGRRHVVHVRRAGAPPADALLGGAPVLIDRDAPDPPPCALPATLPDTMPAEQRLAILITQIDRLRSRAGVFSADRAGPAPPA